MIKHALHEDLDNRVEKRKDEDDEGVVRYPPPADFSFPHSPEGDGERCHEAWKPNEDQSQSTPAKILEQCRERVWFRPCVT